MNDIENMSDIELKQYCIKIKNNGASFGELASIFKRHNTSDQLRRGIMRELNKIDEDQKKEYQQYKKKSKTIGGIYWLIIGCAIFFAGSLVYVLSSRAGVLFIGSIAAWLIGFIVALQGFVLFLRGLKKD